MRGERGAQGDAGHPGHEGQRGMQGVQGAPGVQGVRGVTSRSFGRGMLFIFAFVVVSWLLMAYRVEVQDNNLARYQYEQCQARKANVARTNIYYEGLIRIEQRNPFRQTSPQTIADRIALFRAAKLTPPECGERP